MNLPFFSIVIPTYNRAHLIGKTVASVISQLYTDWELLIIDDGSTDSTHEVILSFNDSRIKYVWQKNAERSMARNNGITQAKGEFICFLDSDDLWRENHLQILYSTIEKNHFKPALYFTGMAWNFADRNEDIVFESPIGKNPVEYVIQNQLAPSTTCLQKDILKTEKFNPSLRINEDVELFARVAAQYDLVQVKDITVDFVIHSQNTKALEKNLVSPQIEAMNMIFTNPALRNKISDVFKKQKIQNLKHQLINYYLAAGEFAKMNKEIIRFLISYPSHFQNKSKIVLLLYHLPGGALLKNVVNKLK